MAFLQEHFSPIRLHWIERSDGCRVLTLASGATLDLLGWEHAKEGDKALDFSEVFDLLGVTFNLKNVQLGTFVISNKIGRVEKLCKMLEDIESAGAITAAKVSEIQGLLNFAVSFHMGKGLKHLVSAFMQFTDGQRSKKNLRSLSACVPTPNQCLANNLESILCQLLANPCWSSQMVPMKMELHQQELWWLTEIAGLRMRLLYQRI